MEKQELSLLRKIVNLKEISLYDLVEMLAREKKVSAQEIFDETMRLVYVLASKNLIKLQVMEGEDGSETIVRSTSLGETYLKSEAVEKAIR